MADNPRNMEQWMRRIDRTVQQQSRRGNGGVPAVALPSQIQAKPNGTSVDTGQHAVIDISGAGRLGDPYIIGADLADHPLYIADWNLAVTDGFYMQGPSSTSNAPTTTDWWMGYVISHRVSYVTQRVWCFTEDLTKIATTWERRSTDDGFGNAIWGPWIRIRHTYSGAVTATTSASGDIVITTGVAVLLTSIAVTILGTTPRQYTLASNGGGSFTLRIFTAAGAALVSTGVTLQWSGTD